MPILTIISGLVLYLAAVVMIVGLAHKIRQYASTPAPLKIPTTPAPLTKAGVAWRLTKEVMLFESLFKASKWTWIVGWLFHAGLTVVLIGHLRYFVQPAWAWISVVQTAGKYAAFAMLAGLTGLWIRRLFVDRVRYISSPSDHLMLVLLIAIGMTGVLMRTVAPVDIVAVKKFVLGLMYFDWQPMPSDPVLVIHLSLVAILMLVFPFSKLLHVPGLFFSPTRNQTDNPREVRHINSWAKSAVSKERPDG
jgi:nitrate reductase gamma subunit